MRTNLKLKHSPFKTLLILLLVTLSSTLFAQQVTKTFKNRSSDRIELKRQNQVIGSIDPEKEIQLTVKVGDVIDVFVPDVPEKKWYPIYINEAKDRGKINIRPNIPWGDLDSRRRFEKPLGYGNNFDGVLITQYDPFAVVRSFSSFPIFKGLKNSSYDYEIRETQIMVDGFFYNGTNQIGDGSSSSNRYVGIDQFKESFNVGLGGKFPLGAKGPTANVDFAYNESKKRNLEESEYFFYSEQNVNIYSVSLGSLKDVRLDDDFIERVEEINSPSDADEFVKRYGTHYPTSVTYGGHYNSYVAISERDYLQAESKGVDLSLGISVSQPGKQTITKVKPNQATVAGSPNSSEVGSGQLGFSHATDKVSQEILNKSNSSFTFVGGNGGFVGWNVTPDNATSIDTELELIYNLIHPYVFKTAWTEVQLKPKRELIQQAVEREISKLQTFNPSKVRTRIVNIRFDNFKLVDHVDDLNRKIKGDFKASINGQTFTFWNQGSYKVLFNNNIYVNPSTDWIPIKQVSDNNGNFQPLVLNLSGYMIEEDDLPGEWDDDRLNMVRGQSIDLSNLNGVINHKVKFENRTSFAEKMDVEASISIRPGFDFASIRTRSSGNQGSQGLGLPKTNITSANTAITPPKFQKLLGRVNVISAADDNTAWGVQDNGTIWRTNSGATNWQQVSGALVVVSAVDYNTAWGTNAAGQIWRTNNRGANWHQIPGQLKSVSGVDYNTAWGVQSSGAIYRTIDGGKNWQRVPGSLSQISAVDYNNAWGVQPSGAIYRTNNGGVKWNRTSGLLTHVSGSAYDTAWGVNSSGAIWRTHDGGVKWEQIPGALKNVSAIDINRVWGTNNGDEIFNTSK